MKLTGDTWREIMNKQENFFHKESNKEKNTHQKENKTEQDSRTENRVQENESDNEQNKSPKDLITRDNEIRIEKIKTSLGQNTGQEKDIEEEGIFINEAGIVLLHPFLYSFLKNMELVNEGIFRDIFSQQKSILLLHYLATGNTKAQEHELVVAKLLCGYPFQQTLDTGIEFSSGDMDGADELLAEVIAQWKIMNGTSPAALREVFLQRRGKLSFKNDFHTLQVEKNTIDILLDRLPWSIHYIKLPWMKNRLTVEWR
jgi:hypothetical protein